MLLINALWLALVVCGTLLGAEQAQDSRLVKAIYAKIQAAHVMSNDPAKLTAQYAEGFWALAVEKERLVLDEPVDRLLVVGQRGLLATFGRKITAFDLQTGAMRGIPNNHKRLITAIAHNGRLDVVTGDQEGKICFWGMKKDSQYYQLFAHNGPVQSLAFLDDDTCVSVGRSGMLIWNWQPPKSPSADSGRINLENMTSFLPIDHCSVAVGMNYGKINIIDVKKRVVHKTISSQGCWPLEALARLPHNKIVSAHRFPNVVCVSDLEKSMCHRIDNVIDDLAHFKHLVSLEDEVVCVPAFSPSILRVKQSTACVCSDVNSLPVANNSINKIVASKAGNFFVVVADGARHVHIVQRVGDEVAEEKIDDEFVEWMNEPAVRPVIEKRPKKKKPWYACG